MKKFLGIIFLTGLLTFILFPDKVNAVPSIEWEEAGSYCGAGQLTASGLRSKVMSNSNKANFVNYLENNFICGNNVGKRLFWAESANRVKYCNDATLETIRAFTHGIVCCPENHTVYFGETPSRSAVCCPTGTERLTLAGRCKTKTEDAPPQPYKHATTQTVPNGSVFVTGEQKYICPAGGCMAVNGTFVDKDDVPPGPFSESEISSLGLTCMLPGQDLGGGNVCFDQQIISQEEFDAINANMGGLSCVEIRDENERQNCLNCLANNQEGQQFFVYSSLGCIDTRQDGFITRLFQIGLGLIGGFAIFRIMWGEVLRQSGEAQKIEQGREMEKAAITALIAIVTAIPLLRFIGINVLQALPFNFLG